MRSTHSAWLLLAVAFVAGCSSSKSDEVSEARDSSGRALASTLPVVTAFEKSDGVQDDEPDFVTPFDENLDFFTPPKMIIPVEIEEPEEDVTGELPPLRLVGFVGASGDKAMVEVDGQMHIVTAGKRLNGVEIVAVKSPAVDVRWGVTELTLDFFKPSKADRAKGARGPASTNSRGLSNVGLSNVGQAATRRTSSGPAVKREPQPRPSIPLPTLPGLPAPGQSLEDDLAEFPDLGVGPGLPPAP